MSAPVLADTPLDRLRDLERRLGILERTARPASSLGPSATIAASKVTAGLFPASTSFRFPTLMVGDAAHSSPTAGYLHTAGTLSGVNMQDRDGTAQWVIYPNAGLLRFWRSGGIGDRVRIDTNGLVQAGIGLQGAFIGQHPVHTTWAAWGNLNQQGSNQYAILQDAAGRTLVNAASGQNLELRSAGALRLTVAATMTAAVNTTFQNEVYADGWFRSNTSGRGWFHEVGGGGWYMSDTTYMRSYADKQIYTGTKVRGGNAAIANSASYGSAFATFGYHSLADESTYAFMHNSSGDSYIGHSTGRWTYFRENNLDCFRYQRSGSATDIRFVGGALPALAGSTAIYATGSGQLGYSSSSERAKIVLGPLDEAMTDDLGQPILDHANPALIEFHPIRYHWRPEMVANAEEINPLYPAGIAGFVAEDIYAVAPNAVTLDGEGLPAGLDTNAMLAYVVGALQHVHRGGHKRLDRLDALEGPGGRLDQIEARLDELRVALTEHEIDNARHTGPRIL